MEGVKLIVTKTLSSHFQVRREDMGTVCCKGGALPPRGHPPVPR